MGTAAERGLSKVSDYLQVVDVLETLPYRLETVMASRALGYRDVAKQSGIPSASLHNLTHGRSISLKNAIRLVKWLSIYETDTDEKVRAHARVSEQDEDSPHT